jgi:hypothetical protein
MNALFPITTGKEVTLDKSNVTKRSLPKTAISAISVVPEGRTRVLPSKY